MSLRMCYKITNSNCYNYIQENAKKIKPIGFYSPAVAIPPISLYLFMKDNLQDLKDYITNYSKLKT